MAKGYPDFFGTSIWPKYGTRLSDIFDADILAGANADIHNFLIQGIIYDGEIEISGGQDFNNMVVYVTIDGVLSYYDKLSVLTLKSGEPMARIVLKTTYQNDDTTGLPLGIFVYRAALGIEVPIHSQFKINIANQSAATIHVYSTFGYYVVV